MIKNLPKEIIYFSIIPIVLIVLVDLIVFIIVRKKDNNFRFNYFIKVSLIIAIAFSLPLIGGYTIWILKNFISQGLVSSNLWYIALLFFLWIVLLVLLIWIYLKSLRELNDDSVKIEEEPA